MSSLLRSSRLFSLGKQAISCDLLPAPMEWMETVEPSRTETHWSVLDVDAESSLEDLSQALRLVCSEAVRIFGLCEARLHAERSTGSKGAPPRGRAPFGGLAAQRAKAAGGPRAHTAGVLSPRGPSQDSSARRSPHRSLSSSVFGSAARSASSRQRCHGAQQACADVLGRRTALSDPSPQAPGSGSVSSQDVLQDGDPKIEVSVSESQDAREELSRTAALQPLQPRRQLPVWLRYSIASPPTTTQRRSFAPLDESQLIARTSAAASALSN